jgi:hypothetical protein
VQSTRDICIEWWLENVCNKAHERQAVIAAILNTSMSMVQKRTFEGKSPLAHHPEIDFARKKRPASRFLKSSSALLTEGSTSGKSHHVD